jgi:cysteinyl-tRNA synthetase
MSDVKIHDTLSGKKRPFVPRSEVVKIYGCGPTVYGYTHVGNARAFLTQDLVVRVLKEAGYKTLFARNYTDVDDKIIQRARDEKKTSEEVASFYAKAFDENMAGLGILSPDFTPRATLTIPQMIEMIAALEKKNLAYAVGGDVYFRVEGFEKYGSLSHRKVDDMISGTRIDPSEHKKSPADFALWKGAKPNEPAWDSPWGKGRPGWHIECSAMIEDLFRGELDIHMGGIDLIFPHHENEIAQSEGFSGRKLANYWIHNGMLEVGKEKMSKSVGNLTSISEFLKTYGAETLRVLFAQNHYRSPLEFSDEVILRSEALVDRLYECKRLSLGSAESDSVPHAELDQLVFKMREALFDDFNSAKALGFVLSAARLCFRESKPAFWKTWGNALPILNDVLGILTRDPLTAVQENRERRLARQNISEEVAERINFRLADRERLRAEKKFSEADEIRKQLEAEGINVMDGPDGTSWAKGAAK